MPRVALCDESVAAQMKGSAGPEARRALMHRPAMADAIGAFNDAVVASELPPRLSELVRYRIALINDCKRCQAYRNPAAAGDGVDDALLDTVERWRTNGQYSEAECDALDFTERFAFDPGSIDDALVDRLRAHLGDGGVVDLTVCITKYLAIGRLIAVLDLDQDLSLGPPALLSGTDR